MEQLCLPLLLNLNTETEANFLLENFERTAQNVVLIYTAFHSCNSLLENNFDREVNTLNIKAFEVPPNSKISWDISQKLQVLGDLPLLLNVLLF